MAYLTPIYFAKFVSKSKIELFNFYSKPYFTASNVFKDSDNETDGPAVSIIFLPICLILVIIQ